MPEAQCSRVVVFSDLDSGPEIPNEVPLHPWSDCKTSTATVVAITYASAPPENHIDGRSESQKQLVHSDSKITIHASDCSKRDCFRSTHDALQRQRGQRLGLDQLKTHRKVRGASPEEGGGVVSRC